MVFTCYDLCTGYSVHPHYHMPTIVKKTARPPWLPKREAFGRMRVDNTAFYNSKEWRRFATTEKKLYPLCDNFDVCGGTHDITDHHMPISEGGHPFDQRMNHYCHSCNASKTGKQAHHNGGVPGESGMDRGFAL